MLRRHALGIVLLLIISPSCLYGYDDHPLFLSDSVKSCENSDYIGTIFPSRDRLFAPYFHPAIVILAYNRVDSLNRSLYSLSQLKGIEFFSVYISVDDGANMVENFIKVIQQPCFAHLFENGKSPNGMWISKRDRDDTRSKKGPRFHITRHYGFVMEMAFGVHSHLVLVEDDMIFSPDFLQYFLETAWLLDRDPTIMCISSWHDNGFETMANNESQLYRNSYFPGLGWMMRRQLWIEDLRYKWPEKAATGWDHWLRLSINSRGRDCIIPEISRNKNYGAVGANVAHSEYKQHLSKIKLSTATMVDFGNVDYLIHEKYETLMKTMVHSAQRISGLHKLPIYSNEEIGSSHQDHYYLYIYKREDYYRLIAKPLGIFSIPRAIYKGLQVIKHNRIKGTLLLADARHCPFLKEEERIFSDPTVESIAALKNENCDRACERVFGTNKHCDPGELEFLNNCESLREMFGCTECGMETGPDLPAYIDKSAALETRGQCLITEAGYPSLGGLTCYGKFKHSFRICACK